MRVYIDLSQLVCAEACVPCQEPCERQCPHSQCEMTCSEPCSADPCSRPCDLILHCGHRCVGLCGDPCPNKCKSCHPEEFEVFFGDEDEEDATFVQLADCGHIIHAPSMDQWVISQSSTSEDQDQTIKLVECPQCKTPVRSTKRYNGVINRQLRQVEAVKRKLRGEVSHSLKVNPLSFLFVLLSRKALIQGSKCRQKSCKLSRMRSKEWMRRRKPSTARKKLKRYH